MNSSTPSLDDFLVAAHATMNMIDHVKRAYKQRHGLTALSREDILAIEMIVRNSVTLLHHARLVDIIARLEALEMTLRRPSCSA